MLSSEGNSSQPEVVIIIIKVTTLLNIDECLPRGNKRGWRNDNGYI